MSNFEDLVFGIREAMIKNGEVYLEDFAKKHSCDIEDALVAAANYQFMFDKVGDTVIDYVNNRIFNTRRHLRDDSVKKPKCKIADDISAEVERYLQDEELNRAMIYRTYTVGEKTFRVEIKIVDVTDFVKED